MIETIILSFSSFIGTNIDDLFITTLFFSDEKLKAKTKSIVIGKYIGISALVLLGLLGAFGLKFIPQRYIGYLGFIPIGLGIKEIIVGRKGKSDEESVEKSKSANAVLNVALITMANGADNIGVYIPLFTGFVLWQMIVCITIFFVLIAVWCFFGKKIAEIPVLKTFLSKYKTVIVPVVYIALGLYIFVKNIF